MQDFVAPGIEIAIAYLLQFWSKLASCQNDLRKTDPSDCKDDAQTLQEMRFQQITAVDIWVYTRVVEEHLAET